jgi:hypothetical protein
LNASQASQHAPIIASTSLIMLRFMLMPPRDQVKEARRFTQRCGHPADQQQAQHGKHVLWHPFRARRAAKQNRPRTLEGARARAA